MKQRLISLVIPCYRSEHSVSHVIEEIIALFEKQSDFDYEIIAVNDNSPDNVIDVLKKAANSNHKIKVVDLAVNRGKHCALLAGFAYVSGEIVITIDDDGQCPVNHLWDLIAPLDKGFDMSIAKYYDKKESKFKILGSQINDFMSRWIFNKPRGIIFSNFIARKRFVADAMRNYQMPYAYLEGLSLQTTHKIALVEMPERKGMREKTGFTFKRSLALLMNGYTTFSTKPLHIIGLFGLVMFCVSLLYFIILGILSFNNYTVDYKYHIFFSFFIFFTSLIFFALQLIGEYVGRILVTQHTANQYVVKETINIE